ncbi:MAG: hypothetical protein PHI27_01380 [Eubacteriales bacterium]|nr:hypothetical protein [Eubacteriales bacterium]MDD3880887.1 hypothetical protein [Eubacteriales bacterium]MDD4511746.1 hypothetical protein [Eubacteriales bacterium]
MNKFFVCLLSVLLLVSFSLTAFAQSEFTVAGFDGDDIERDWTTHAFFSRMQEKTGVTLTLKQYRDYAEYQKAIDSMLTSGEMPDAFFKAELTNSDLVKYSASGKLIDLAPYLESCCPNLSALLASHPEWREAITLPGGVIAALPSITDVPRYDMLWLNEKWLKNVGCEMPNTIEEFTEVLRAFRDMDANGNGDPEDELPLCFQGPYELKLLAAAFGIVMNDYNVYLGSDGQVQFGASGDNYRKFVEWCANAYSRGLISRESFYGGATAIERVLSSASTDVLENLSVYGSFLAPSVGIYVSNSESADYSVAAPFEYEGKRVWRDLFGEVTTGAFAITSACKDPETLLKWIDNLYSEDGAVLASVGKEGSEYLLRDDGTWYYDTEPEGSYGFSEPAEISYMYTITGSGAVPFYEPIEFLKRFRMDGYVNAVEEPSKVKPYAISPYPTVYLSAEKLTEIQEIQAELGECVDLSLARFVLGEEKLTDETWAEYESELDALGRQKLVSFWQEALSNR